MKKLTYLFIKRFAYVMATMLLVSACAKDDEGVTDGGSTEQEPEYIEVYNEVPENASVSSLEETLIDLYGESYSAKVKKIRVLGEIDELCFATLKVFEGVDLSDCQIIGTINVYAAAPGGSESTDGVNKGCLTKVDTGRSIPRYAFAVAATGVPVLREIILPNNLDIIGKSAFYGNSKLERVTFVEPTIIPEPEYEYNEFGELVEIEIEDPIMSIYPGAFQGCRLLTEFKIEELGCDKILENAFDGCTGLLEFDVPRGVTKLGNQAFGGCTSLSRVSIPSTVKTMGSTVGHTSMFLNCTALETITLNWTGSNIPVIDQTTFPPQFRTNSKQCVLTLPTEIDSESFDSNIDAYQSIVGWNYYGMALDSDTSSVEDIYNKLEYTVASAAVSTEEGDSSSTLYDQLVAYYGDDFMDTEEPHDFLIVSGTITANDFKYMQNFTRVDLLGVSTIGFYNDVENGIYFGAGVIPDDAFYGNEKIVTFIPPKSLNHTVGKRAFMNCINLKYYEVYTSNSNQTNNNKASIYDEDCFNGCVSLVGNSGSNSHTGDTQSGFIFAKSVRVTVGDRAFYNCSSLVTPKFQDTALGSGETVNQYDGVQSIGEEAFSGCESIETLSFSRGLRSIGEYAFDGCISLKTVKTGWGIGEVDFIEVPQLADNVFPEEFTEGHNGGIAEPEAEYTIVVKSGTEKMFNGIPGWRQYAMKNDSAGATTYDTNTIYIPNTTGAIYDSYVRCEFSAALTSFYNANEEYYLALGSGSADDLLKITGYMMPSDVITLKNDYATNRWKTIDMSGTFLTALCAGLFDNSGVGESILQVVKFPSTLAVIPDGMFANCNKLNEINFGWESPSTFESANSDSDGSNLFPDRFKKDDASGAEISVSSGVFAKASAAWAAYNVVVAK